MVDLLEKCKKYPYFVLEKCKNRHVFMLEKCKKYPYFVLEKCIFLHLFLCVSELYDGV